METFIGLIVLLGLVALILPIVMSVTNASRLRALESTIKKLSERIGALEAGQPRETVAKESQPVPTPPVTRAMPPPLPVFVTKPPPAPAPSLTSPVPAAAAPAPVRRAIDWEAFMGVKLFAWIGGFVFFLGVVFLVKYSFENNLITPRMRIAIGAIIGLGLIAAGWRATKKNYRVPGQSLCATGILVLYADIFAAEAFYNLISLTPAFALMSCVTIVAFFLAVVLNAQVVVILGLARRISHADFAFDRTRQPARIVRLHCAAQRRHRRSRAAQTMGSSAPSRRDRHRADGVRVGLEFLPCLQSDDRPSPIFLGFQLLFLLLFFLRRKNATPPKWAAWAAALCGFAALFFAAWILADYPGLARRAGFLFSFIFAADIGLVILAIASGLLFFAEIAGIAVFGLLAGWTAGFLDASLLWWGLGSYVVFALLHAGFAIWPRAAVAPKTSWRLQSFIPLLPLVLIWLCVWHDQDSAAVWLSVLAH